MGRVGAIPTQNVSKNRVGGWVVNLNLDNVFKWTLFFFGGYPLGEPSKKKTAYFMTSGKKVGGPRTKTKFQKKI